MASPRRNRRRRSVIVLLILTAVTLITVDERGRGADGGRPFGPLSAVLHDVLAPAESVVDAVITPIGNFFEGLSRGGSLRKENARLTKELDAARIEIAKREAQSRENARLRKLLDLPSIEGIERTSAHVIGGSPSNYEWSILIDKGTRDGVAVGMPVVAGDGLVGRIVESSRTRSKVLLLTDPTMGVSVRLAISGEAGFTQGQAGSDLLRLDMIPGESDLKSGEVAVTSGLEGGRFPPDIPVGEVASAKRIVGSLDQDVRLRPLVDFERLAVVSVLFWSPLGTTK